MRKRNTEQPSRASKERDEALRERDQALAFQAATDEILTAISRSRSDAKLVFEAIVRSVPRLFRTRYVSVFLVKGDELHLAAAKADPRFEKTHAAVFRKFRESFPQPIDYRGFTGKALRSGKVSQIAPIIGDLRATPQAVKLAREFGYNTMLVAPLMRDGKAIGAIGTTRPEVKRFTAKELALFERFAAQAVIAIENARLFNETKEALEQQTATSEVLGVISRSPTDLRPVFDAILKSATELCEAHLGLLDLYDGEKLRTVAQRGGDAKVARWAFERGAFRPESEFIQRVIAERRPSQIPDLKQDSGYRERRPNAVNFVELGGARTFLAVPLLKADTLIGIIAIYRPEVRPFTDKQIALVNTFANQAVIAIENARLFNETKEALEQQTATAGVLRVIAGSPTDLKPVMNAVVESAARLLEADHALIGQSDGENIHWLGAYGCPVPDGGRSITRKLPSGRAILDLQTTQIEDIGQIERDSLIERSYSRFGVRTICATPLIREGRAVGVILLRRTQVRPFTEKQMSLLRTFADQAAIAIENVRLFNETAEALEQQTASNEILRVISSSPSDLRPVFNAILESATRLCDAHLGVLNLFEGEMCRTVAQRGGTSEFAKWVLERGPFKPVAAMARILADRRPFHVPDAREGPGFKARNLNAMKFVELGGVRTYLAVPLLKEGAVIGSINIFRPDVRPFTDKQIALVSTFANQAVIAIENARLFNETRESLERQTATSDVLRVISSSPTDVQPVLDSIAERAAILCNAKLGFVGRFDGKLLHMAAFHGASGESLQTMRALYPMDPLTGGSVAARVVRSRAPVQIADVFADPEYAHKAAAQAAGYRGALGVPLLREGEIVGAIIVVRAEAGLFPRKQVEMLETFADQAVIAIENARLFNETKEALERQTATAEILKVISASPSDVQPVFDAVAENAARVCGVDDVAILRTEGGDLRRVAHYGSVPVSPDSLVPVPPGSVNERVLSERRTLHVPDTAAPSFAREFPGSQFPAMGVRSLLATPLVHDGVAIGVIHLRRSEPRPFTDKQIALLETFADQAVIAIENVRLFNETREALERQTATGEILASMSGSMTDTKPVFDAIVRSLLRLFGTGYAVVALRRGQVFELAGFQGEPGFERLQEVYPLPVDRNTSIGEVVIAGQVRKYTPVVGNPAVPRGTAELGQRFGFNSVMVAPMMWKGEAIGAILTARRHALPFDDKQVALIQSFADQAVIAIENVRLFKELQERTEALTRSVGQLTALGDVGRAISSTLELDEVLRTIVQRAVQLAGLDGGSIYEFDESDGRFHLRAAQNVADDVLAVYRSSPIRLGEGAVGRAGATREPVAVKDVRDDNYRSRAREMLIKSGARALLAVPLLREQLLLGALVVSRKSPGPFAPEVVELLKTFATQSAVAIQNARLFRELAQKSRELEDASRHKSQFLASMSHELRTPLNAILGFNEMILGQVYGEVPTDMKEPLEDIQKSGRHLLRLINNVLDLAKIEAGKMELALADYSVQDTVESVRSTLRPLAEAKGLELVVRVPEDIPLAYGDGGRLTQCLMNLAGNSLKFTKEGRVEIAVEAENGCLRWRVSDTGIGIPPDKIPTLFSEFKQTDATIASEYGGTGLGLSITRKFVEMHGGRIWVESEPGKGSVFTVEIPLRVTAPA
jgi:GAF domain-containing protein